LVIEYSILVIFVVAPELDFSFDLNFPSGAFSFSFHSPDLKAGATNISPRWGFIS
jgi:hypothetical protein